MQNNSVFTDTAEKLIERIGRSTSPAFAVLTAAEELRKEGFRELPMTGNWKEAGLLENLEKERKIACFTRLYDTTLFAFLLEPGELPGFSLRVAAAHTDSPCFQVKPSPDMNADGYHKLNIEDYGGMIKLSWTDRPLSLSGRVVVKGEDPFRPEVRFLDMKRPLLTIPNLAIHMNREVNNGKAYNSQTDMIPMLDAAFSSFAAESEAPGAKAESSATEKSDRPFRELLAEELGLPADAILDYDLRLYPVEQGTILGWNRSLLSCPRLDNLSSVFPCTDALAEAKKQKCGQAGNRKGKLSVIAFFDNEEVGSATKQGAGSSSLLRYLEKLYACLGFDSLLLQDDLYEGLMLSIDAAHAVHPNVPQKSDPTNRVKLNGGVVLKQAASQRYVSDCQGVAVVKALCERAGVPCQDFVNRSDEKGGSTLGAIASSFLPMRAVDIGLPLLAMHSAREVTGVQDPYYMTELLTAFFTT